MGEMLMKYAELAIGEATEPGTQNGDSHLVETNDALLIDQPAESQDSQNGVIYVADNNASSATNHQNPLVSEKTSEAPATLYSKILPLVQTSPEVLPEGSVMIQISGDNELQIGERYVQLKGAALYLWNALMLNLGGPRSSSELRALGFLGNDDARSRVDYRFYYAMKRLNATLAGAAGQPLILKQGTASAMTYQLAPQVIVVDRRGPADQGNVKKN